ncbi:MAG TPA: hypothetical protein VGE38_15865 [Nocardioides sp.]|uniref:hypothetical protein n=1 Tax=Nocardioides sp. TaxID=35761 RepID=UPI002ED9D2BF
MSDNDAASPDGAGWFALPTSEDDAERADDLPVGRRIRIMVDGPGVPIWGEYTRLPDEPELLRQLVDVSPGLIEDLRDWNDRMAHRLVDDEQTWEREGEILRRRLAAELGDDFDVDLRL